MAANWTNILEQSIAWRRQLHQIPELGWQEHKTATFIRTCLDQLGVAWQPCADTGTLARLATAARGEHIALRADMDALPMDESSDQAWRSQHPGRMHACGHDGHSATLLATAAWLKAHEASLAGPVTLIFQPAEEGGHGAKAMIDAGALQGVDRIFGWHNWPAIAWGQAVCPDGTVMAGNGTFRIELNGQGGHASQPELCADPVLAASALCLNLQQIVSRRLPPQHATVLSVTSIQAASSATVIPQQAVLEGSFRIAQPQTRARLADLIAQIADDTAASYGVVAQTNIFPRYQATVNHGSAAEQYRQALAETLGPDWHCPHSALPIMASEDFSYYLQAIPGAFALIGANDGPAEHAHPCHHRAYDFNDRLIARVTEVYARLVGAPIPEPDNWRH